MLRMSIGYLKAIEQEAGAEVITLDMDGVDTRRRSGVGRSHTGR